MSKFRTAMIVLALLLPVFSTASRVCDEAGGVASVVHDTQGLRILCKDGSSYVIYNSYTGVHK